MRLCNRGVTPAGLLKDAAVLQSEPDFLKIRKALPFFPNGSRGGQAVEIMDFNMAGGVRPMLILSFR